MVVGGAGDCAAGAVGNGIVSRGTLSTSIGTSGIMFVHSDTVEVDPAGRLHTFCHAVHGKWHMMGVSLSGGGCLQWFRNRLCQAEIAAAKKSKIDPYEILTAEAAKIPPGSEGLIFLPYLSGERTPHADPDARACFIGLTLAHTRGHMVRAIMEGVSYAMRDSLAIIQELGVPVRQIRASGGGSKSPLWRQIQADVFGQKVVTINAEEGPAYGVACWRRWAPGPSRTSRKPAARRFASSRKRRPTSAASKISRRGVSDLPEPVPRAEGRLQAHLRRSRIGRRMTATRQRGRDARALRSRTLGHSARLIA